MKKIQTLDEYKQLIRWNKERLGKVEKNCFLMSSVMEKYIMEQRLYVQTFEDGLVLFVDEERYYNMYYFWRPDTKMVDFRQQKPVLVEELNNNGYRDKYIANLEPLLFNVGFEVIKNNLQLEINLKDKRLFIEKQLNEKIQQLKDKNLRVGLCRDNETFKQAIALWESALDITDIPGEHMSLREDDKLVCVFTQEKEVVATNWWRSTNKNSEGRHIVTRSDFFKRGLASTLVLAWCKDACEQGIERCFTWVCDTNFRSLSLFNKLGFTTNGRESKQYILK